MINAKCDNARLQQNKHYAYNLNGKTLQFDSDHTRHFSNRCDITSIYKVAKVVHGNRSDNHCNQLDAQPSVLLVLPATTLFY